MKLSCRQLYRWGLVAFMVAPFWGCVMAPAKKEPVFLHPSFKATDIQSITILPILDRRIDKSLDTDLNEVLNIVKRHLEGKTYNITLSSQFGADAILSMPVKEIAKADPSWVKTLGPADSRWVLLLVVRNLERKILISATAVAEVFGYLYDKSIGEKIWEGKGSGEFTIGLLYTFMADDTALANAANDLSLSFPAR